MDDPYCYRDTTVFKNRFRYRDQIELEKAEEFFTSKRADEPLPPGKLSYRYYCKINRHLFHDVYSWAGRIRTVRISKDGNPFCYPENIDREMHRIFSESADDNWFRDLLPEKFAVKAAHLVSELNAIHPRFAREMVGHKTLS